MHKLYYAGMRKHGKAAKIRMLIVERTIRGKRHAVMTTIEPDGSKRTERYLLGNTFGVGGTR